MKKSLIIGLSVFIILTGTLLWYFSDSQVVKRRTYNLAKQFTIELDDSKSRRVLKSQHLASLLAADFKGAVDTKNYNREFGRDELISSHQYLVQKAQSSRLIITNLKITSMTKETATVSAEFTGSIDLKNDSHNDSGNAVFTWKKTHAAPWELQTVTLD